MGTNVWTIAVHALNLWIYIDVDY